MIKIQKDNFNVEVEINNIKKLYKDVGAVSSFIGYVRNTNNDKNVKSINLEVYPEMANKYLDDLCKKVKKKWNIIDILIIHRFGKLKVNEKIVLVVAFSMHRNECIKASSSIMNYLKKDAPFWKKEKYNKHTEWL